MTKMDILTLIFLVGVGAIIVGFSGKIKKSDSIKTAGGVMIALAVVLNPAILTGMISTLTAGVDMAPDADIPDQDLVDAGEDANIYFSAYTGTWGGASSKTEVYPVWSLMSNGATIISDAAANTTAQMAVADTGTLYCTGSTYYTDPFTFRVVKKTQTLDDVDAYSVVSATGTAITAYDDTGNTALVADNHANNTADYAGGALGAGETYVYHIKYKNNQKDNVTRLGAILTYYCGGEVDDFTLEEDTWTATGVISVPDGDLDTGFLLADDAAENTTCYIKHAYEPIGKDYIELQEWEFVKYQFVIDTDDTTGPTANGDSYVGAIFVDHGCEFDASGDIVCDWYKHNNNNDPDDVGRNEAVVTLNGGYNDLYIGVAIEPQ